MGTKDEDRIEWVHNQDTLSIPYVPHPTQDIEDLAVHRIVGAGIRA